MNVYIFYILRRLNGAQLRFNLSEIPVWSHPDFLRNYRNINHNMYPCNADINSEISASAGYMQWQSNNSS